MNLSPLQQDAVNELLNVGIGQAAAALSEMVHDEILLSLPEVSFVSQGVAASQLASDEQGHLLAVRQGFSGMFAGNAVLIFPERRSLELVRAIFGDAVDPDHLSEMQEEAFNEIGNIILNGCLSSLADMLGKPVESGLPLVVRGDAHGVLGIDAGDHDMLALLLNVAFEVHQSNIRGHVVIMLDLGEAEVFLGLIDDFLRQF